MANLQSFETAYYKGQPFDLKINGRAEVAQTCPVCSESRKKKSDPCLTYNSEKGLGICHHCGATFHKKEQIEPFDYINYFAHRKISKDTLDHFGISFDGKAIAFTFKRNGQTCFNKHRTPDKKFWIDKGAELIGYNLDGLKGFNIALIVEGEIDCLSMHEAGTPNVISVPNGAVKDGRNTFAWLDRSWSDMQHIEQFIIATDNDQAGNNLASQLIAEFRKRGKEAVRVIPRGKFKDVNEQLCAIGEIILDAVEDAANESEMDLLLKQLEVTEQPPDEVSLIEAPDGVSIGSPCNYIVLSGKQKVRKTLLMLLFAAWCKFKVIIFDTEQGRSHVWKVKDRIKRFSGKDVPVFFLRGQSYMDRRMIIEAALKKQADKPRVIFIDGVRDLLSNINDENQTSELITWIEKITNEYQALIVLVLHQNKTDGNLRGHLGTELGNKSQTVIEVKLDEQAGISIASCGWSRDTPFSEFAFTHGVNGLPELVNVPTDGKVLSDDERKNRIRFVFNDCGELMKYADLVNGIKIHFSIGTNKAKSLIGEMNRNGWIAKSGNDRTKDVLYKCLI